MFSFARARRGVRGAVCSFDNIVMPFIGPPWAKPASRFSAIFERLVIDWLKDATSEAVRKATALSWDEVEGIMQRAVNRGLARRKPVCAPFVLAGLSPTTIPGGPSNSGAVHPRTSLCSETTATGSPSQSSGDLRPMVRLARSREIAAAPPNPRA